MTGPGVAAVLDLAGIFVFAVSGALAAVRQRLDVVGMVVLAEITALGGGIIRDLVIGAVPRPRSPTSGTCWCRSRRRRWCSSGIRR